MTPRILIVEDNSQTALWLRLHLESIWPDCQPMECSLAQMIDQLTDDPAGNFDLVLIGILFGADDQSAFAELAKVRAKTRRQTRLQVLLIATNGDELAVVKSMRLGVDDYLPRQLVTPQFLEQRLRAALRRARLRVTRERRRKERKSAATVASVLPTTDAESGAVAPQIPRFTMKKLIGKSARAEVWLASSNDLQQEVAIKISSAQGTESGEQSVFAREYAAVAALDHPGVVEVYDYGVHEQHEYLAMEYFPNGDLKQRMKRRLTPRLSTAYLKRIAEALQPVHHAGLMHLDLKPANIMVRENGSLVLIDFGLVKHTDSIAGSTAVGVRRGSPYYMSPEQVNGLQLDARSDIYSLGVIFYEMLTGMRPYQGTSVFDLMDSHVNAERPRLPKTVERYDALLDQMMAKNRDERITDAAELLGKLAQLDERTADKVPEELLAQA